jgi:hypothetical protein
VTIKTEVHVEAVQKLLRKQPKYPWECGELRR